MEPAPAKITLVRLVLTFLYLLLFPALLLWISGNWLWLEGWVFSLWFLGLCFTVILYLYKHDPELLLERYKQPGQGNQKSWDRLVVVGLVVGFLTWIILMPLDACRYRWTAEMPLWFKLLGLMLLFASSFFFFRSYRDNTFLSPLVRIQEERAHQLITTGVYGIVRHPMYLAALLLFVGAPLLMGSLYGLIAGGALVILLACRTLGEEKMLAHRFPDYEGYRKKVRFRLIPGIW